MTRRCVCLARKASRPDRPASCRSGDRKNRSLRIKTADAASLPAWAIFNDA
jgi:hypothetical protein